MRYVNTAMQPMFLHMEHATPTDLQDERGCRRFCALLGTGILIAFHKLKLAYPEPAWRPGKPDIGDGLAVSIMVKALQLIPVGVQLQICLEMLRLPSLQSGSLLDVPRTRYPWMFTLPALLCILLFRVFTYFLALAKDKAECACRVGSDCSWSGCEQMAELGAFSKQLGQQLSWQLLHAPANRLQMPLLQRVTPLMK